jgi:hypothetical protein
MTQEIDDGLTDEERAALAEDDGGAEDTTTDADDGAGADDGKGTESPEDKAKAGVDDTATDAAADTASDAKADDAAAGATETQPQPAPLLVAQVPENVDAKLAEITTQKGSLLDQFDNGDITAKEYQLQLDALNKQERQIERQIERAETAAEMEKQRLQNDWNATCNSFVETHPIYKDNQRLYKALDAEVRELATKPETANWSGQKFLDEAHKNLKAAFGFQDAAQTQDTKRKTPPQRELPPNLAKIPAADVEDTNGGRFAVLDRLANTDPVAYEETLNKMSASERDAYLSA